MEFLLRIVDRSTRDDDSKAGDIIAAHPDDAQWSVEECANDFWRIVRADVLQTTIDALLSTSRGRVPNVVRRRDWYIDVTKLPGPERFVGKRDDVIIDVTRGQFMAAMTKKP